MSNKILICGDVHWSTYSSIVRRRGSKYSKRLENLINSVNWVEEQAENYNCSRIIYAGDFFDRPDLSAEELTALQEITWADVRHTMLVGNHEGFTNTLDLSSTHLFKLIPNAEVIDNVQVESNFGYRILFLPYIKNDQKLSSISEYLKRELGGVFETQEVKYNIAISHNDIKMQFGSFESTEGFNPEDIDQNFAYFFNGHLHSGSKFSKAGYNIGNLTGQNFSEDASKYKHQICIFDTDTEELVWLENPYAFNFYKFEVSTLDTFLSKLKNLKTNSVVTIKAPEVIVPEIKKHLENSANVVESKVISTIVKSENIKDSNEISLNCINHLESFVTYIKENLEMNDLIVSELSEVCR